MLTKDLLNTRVTKGTVHPQLVPLDDPGSLEVSEQVVGINAKNVGLDRAALTTLVNNEVCYAKPKFIDALEKLFHDRCEFADPDPSVLTTRWDLILAAKRLRLEGRDALKHEEFTEELCLQFQDRLGGKNELDAPGALRSLLYADLPEKATLRKAADLSPSQLLNLYNIAQIQGVLMHAREIRISVRLPTIQDRRLFITTLKFHQLLWTFDDQHRDEKKDFSIEISGPLQVFSQHLKYGRSLARFFPTLLWFDVVSLEGSVQMDKKNLNLNLGKKHFKVLEAPTPKPSRYQPDWLTDLFTDLNQSPIPKWTIEECNDYIHLGSKSACFPDLICKKLNSNDVVYIEIFHRWHQSQFQSRQEATIKTGDNKLILLAQKSLLGKNKSKNEDEFIVSFGEMITARKIKECLEK